MSKVTRVKTELEETTALMELVEILKNIASNHFYRLFRSKTERAEFEKVFDEFFAIASQADDSGLIVDSSGLPSLIVSFSAEGGFMADLTAKIVKATIEAGKEYNAYCYFMVGVKGAIKLRGMVDKEVVLFTDVEAKGAYKIAVELKDKAMQLVSEGKVGEIYMVFPQAKTISLVKQNVVKMFPPEHFEAHRKEIKEKSVKEKLIFESNGRELMFILSGIWITFRIMMMLEECSISGYAAQSGQLESSTETLNKIRKKLNMDYRKAKRAEIDKSLREVFSAALMMEAEGVGRAREKERE
jgi:F0F1-type ATP synthase gamma subunit